jgi:hypothetical protein
VEAGRRFPHDSENGSPLAVIRAHSAFEHHFAMHPQALIVFLHEYRIGFPVFVDAHDDGDPLPRTLRA